MAFMFAGAASRLVERSRPRRLAVSSSFCSAITSGRSAERAPASKRMHKGATKAEASILRTASGSVVAALGALGCSAPAQDTEAILSPSAGSASKSGRDSCSPPLPAERSQSQRRPPTVSEPLGAEAVVHSTRLLSPREASTVDGKVAATHRRSMLASAIGFASETRRAEKETEPAPSRTTIRSRSSRLA